MPAEVFFDTTILIYTVTENDPRADIAANLLADGGTISVQVLNEFAAVARRKLRMDLDEIEEALTSVRVLCDEPVSITVKLHESALRIAKRYGFHIYDSLIVAAALEAECTTLYSEDMQHGQIIDSLTIQNPFLTQ
jgi:predicted nucleic acid-binding protein